MAAIVPGAGRVVVTASLDADEVAEAVEEVELDDVEGPVSTGVRVVVDGRVVVGIGAGVSVVWDFLGGRVSAIFTAVR